MILARLLADSGHIVGACRWCGRVFAADLDHQGRRHAPTRLYCSIPCRKFARNSRRRPVRAHLRRWAALIAMHTQEQAGQLPAYDDPLPPIPTLELEYA